MPALESVELLHEQHDGLAERSASNDTEEVDSDSHRLYYQERELIDKDRITLKSLSLISDNEITDSSVQAINTEDSTACNAQTAPDLSSAQCIRNATETLELREADNFTSDHPQSIPQNLQDSSAVHDLQKNGILDSHEINPRSPIPTLPNPLLPLSSLSSTTNELDSSPSLLIPYNTSSCSIPTTVEAPTSSEYTPDVAPPPPPPRKKRGRKPKALMAPKPPPPTVVRASPRFSSRSTVSKIQSGAVETELKTSTTITTSTTKTPRTVPPVLAQSSFNAGEYPRRLLKPSVPIPALALAHASPPLLALAHISPPASILKSTAAKYRTSPAHSLAPALESLSPRIGRRKSAASNTVTPPVEPQNLGYPSDNGDVVVGEESKDDGDEDLKDDGDEEAMPAIPLVPCFKQFPGGGLSGYLSSFVWLDEDPHDSSGVINASSTTVTTSSSSFSMAELQQKAEAEARLITRALDFQARGMFAGLKVSALKAQVEMQSHSSTALAAAANASVLLSSSSGAGESAGSVGAGGGVCALLPAESLASATLRASLNETAGAWSSGTSVIESAFPATNSNNYTASASIATNTAFSSASETIFSLMLVEMRRVATLRAQQWRGKISNAKKIARAVQRYWELKRTEGERFVKSEEKRLRKMAKFLASEISKKWKIIDMIIKAKQKDLLKQEQERLGKVQLQAILTQSTQILTNVVSSVSSAQLSQPPPPPFSYNTAVPLASSSFSSATPVVSSLADDVSDAGLDDDELDEESGMLDNGEGGSSDEDSEGDQRDVEVDDDNDDFDNHDDEDQDQDDDGEDDDDDDDHDDDDDNGEDEDEESDIPLEEILGGFDRTVSASASPDESFSESIDDDDGNADGAGEVGVDGDDTASLNAIARGATMKSADTVTLSISENTVADADVLMAVGGENGELEEVIEKIVVHRDDCVVTALNESLDGVSSESHFDPLIDSRPNSENHDTELEQEGNVGQQQPQQTLGRGDDKRMPVAGVQHDAEMLVDDGCKPKQLVVENNDMHHDMAADVEDVEGGELSSDLQKHVDLPTGNTLTTTDVKVKVPFLLRHTLREYQHVGLDWLAKLYTNGLSGILADEMGLGKTIQTIALIAYLAVEKGVWGPHLIVVPTSVMLNWEFEFKKWCPGLKILTYYGSQAQRKERRVGWSKPNAFHVCITSYQTVLTDQIVLRRKAWQYLILDEAHNIKNFRSQRWQVLLNFNTQRRLLLTGTPLQNNLMELWSLMYFLMPNGLSAAMPTGFATLKEFQEWFSRPVEQLVQVGSEGSEEVRGAIAKLHTVLRPYLLRRLKKDVEKQMPGKYEHVVYCRLSLRQRYLYDEFMSRAKTKEDLASGNFMSIINCLMQLRKVCNHPDLFEVRPIVTSLALHGGVTAPFASLYDMVLRKLNLLGSSKGDWPGGEDSLQLNLSSWNLLVGCEQIERVSWLSAQCMSRLDPDRRFEETVIRSAQTEMALHSQLSQNMSRIEGSHGAIPAIYSNVAEHSSMLRLRHATQTTLRWFRMRITNRMRCQQFPIYGSGLLGLVRCLGMRVIDNWHPATTFSSLTDLPDLSSVSQPSNQSLSWDYSLSDSIIGGLVPTLPERMIKSFIDHISRFAFVTPKARVVSKGGGPCDGPPDGRWSKNAPVEAAACSLAKIQGSSGFVDVVYAPMNRLTIAFPDRWLLQFDCGKLQTLAGILRNLKAGGHRALIFTQMTRVLDILEQFLNLHGHLYLRLDGATKIEQRKILMDRFNNDDRILVFILSTRSGGVGMNLTGADSVIFYDSDWNPAMDAQAQDRAHRIGQTRDVHIYRLISEHTIEENMLKKANEKRQLDNVVIQEGQFTMDQLKRADWRDWLDDDMTRIVGGATEDKDIDVDIKEAATSSLSSSSSTAHTLPVAGASWEDALMAVEDESDVKAMQSARTEMAQELVEFDDAAVAAAAAAAASSSYKQDDNTLKTTRLASDAVEVSAKTVVLESGHIDDYMLRFWGWNLGLPESFLLDLFS